MTDFSGMSFDAPLEVYAPGLREPAFTVARPQRVKAPILFASPHSGTIYPSDLTERLALPLINLRRTEDAFVDQLFASAPDQGATLIHANYARSYVDLNRDARELDADMFSDGLPRTAGLPGTRVKAGLGCLPKVGSTGEIFYASKLTAAEGKKRLTYIHDAYHSGLKAELDQLRRDWPECILIDCHSMPSRQPGRGRLPDIVLGDRFGSSCHSKLTSLVERYFRKVGFSVARNAPYAGGYITRAYGRPKRGCHVLQIEINRSLYMDEQMVKKNRGFEPTENVISQLVSDLMVFAARFCG
ncbi:MAG: N-formylglutamate amidohydrolase [Pseudomonadota bacterium]